MSKVEMINKMNRVVMVLNKLNLGEIVLRDIAKESNVSLRSIQRDIRLIEEAGFPLYQIEGGRYSFVEGFSLKKIKISEQEAAILALMTDFASTIGSGFANTFKDLRSRLISAKQENSPFYIKLQKGVDYKHTPITKTIEKAINNKEKIELTYLGGSKPKYIVKPLKIAWIEGFWYLMALNSTDNLFKLRMDKIISATNTKETFTYNKNINNIIKESSNVWFGEKRDIKIKIQASSYVAHYFKHKTYLPLQKIIKENKDGSLILSCKAASNLEITPIIMHWIPDLKVLSPKSLATAVKQQIKDYLAK